MPLLKWRKWAEYNQADELLVRRHLAGDFPASIVHTKILGDVYQKYDPNTGSKIPKEPHEVFEASRGARINWGYLHRALQNLYRSGWIEWYTLKRTGELEVQWFEGRNPNPGIKYKPVLPYVEPMHPSEITPEMQEERYTDFHRERKRKSTVNRYHDLAPSRREVEGRLAQDKKDLHSEAARAKRARDFWAESSACDRWGDKYKLNPDYFSDVVQADTRPFMEKLNSHWDGKGTCAWPSPYFKIVEV